MIARFMNWGMFVAVTLSFFGCTGKAKTSDKSGASAAASAELVSDGVPSKDIGTIEGTIVIEGDPALVLDADSQKIPTDCDVARQVYPPLFREGPGRTVADVFVGVTGYRGNARQKTGPVEVEAKGCAFSTRTVAITKSQHIAVKSGDDRSYVPSLFGARSKATLVAVPHGTAVPVYHRGAGQYVLVDDMRIFAQATVLVVDYPTFDVTKLDGKFRIEGVPAGNVEVSAFLPAANLNVTKKVAVERNRVTRVPLILRFDAAAFKAARTKRNGSAEVTPLPSASQ